MVKRVILAGTLAAVLGCAGSHAEDTGKAKEAPDFNLKGVDGTEHSLSSCSGKFVVLEWTNHDCPFVQKQYNSGNMQKLQKKYTEKGVVWFTVCSSAPGKQGNYPPDTWNKKMAEKGAAPTAMLLDPDGTTGRAYGAKTTPHMFVVNPEGKIIYQGAIDDDPSADPKRVAKAANYVAAALDAAMAGDAVEVGETRPYGCGVKYR